MSDHLLRLAELVTHLTCDMYPNGDARIERAAGLVRDLEAAPAPVTDLLKTLDPDAKRVLYENLWELYEGAVALPAPRTIDDMPDPPAGIVFKPAPERRTITREEFASVAQQLRNREVEYPDDLAHVFAAAWRLTVEGA